jgi:hypothetical protein
MDELKEESWEEEVERRWESMLVMAQKMVQRPKAVPERWLAKTMMTEE